MNLQKLISTIYESKSHIGWTHGVLSVVGGVVLAFFSGTLLTSFLAGDFPLRIVPSMILTPILVSIFGIWILFSNTIYTAIQKTFGGILIFLLIFAIKGLS
ncbi:MAG: hypothetical protein OIF32_06610 [Campylobacterales bacterium]|nr:hypothetical protein [Campylobacterales bacterium]